MLSFAANLLYLLLSIYTTLCAIGSLLFIPLHVQHLLSLLLPTGINVDAASTVVLLFPTPITLLYHTNA